MHVILLGTCRDLYASSLGFWIRQNFYGTGSLEERLLQFAVELRESCRREKNLPFNGFQFLFFQSDFFHVLEKVN